MRKVSHAQSATPGVGGAAVYFYSLLAISLLIPFYSQAQDIHFVEQAQKRGIDFTHENGATGKKYTVETFCGGSGIFEYDGDGDLDV